MQLAVVTIINRGDTAQITALLDLLIAPTTDPRFAINLLAGLEQPTRGAGDERRRLKLPVEPTALVKFAGKGNAALAQRASALLEFIDGPAAQAAQVQVVPLTEAEQLRFTQGETTFALCAGCHQTSGRGLPGLAPSLVGSPWAVGPAEIAAAIVLKGKEGEQLAMPPLETLDDASIAAALTFVRRSWGHGASAVTTDEVAAARQKYESRSSPWTESDLAELATTLNR